MKKYYPHRPRAEIHIQSKYHRSSSIPIISLKYLGSKKIVIQTRWILILPSLSVTAGS